MYRNQGRDRSMDTGIAVALITLGGSALGTFAGIALNSKMTAYRIEQLEKKVDKHNSFAERLPVLEEQMKVVNHRVGDLESEVKK